jgi:hypothetical protein
MRDAVHASVWTSVDPYFGPLCAIWRRAADLASHPAKLNCRHWRRAPFQAGPDDAPGC